MQERWVRSLGWDDPLEEGMATHSRIPAWRISWTEKLGRLPSKGSQRIRQDWSDWACAQAFGHHNKYSVSIMVNPILQIQNMKHRGVNNFTKLYKRHGLSENLDLGSLITNSKGKPFIWNCPSLELLPTIDFYILSGQFQGRQCLGPRHFSIFCPSTKEKDFFHQ